MRWLNSTDMDLRKLQEIVKGREAWRTEQLNNSSNLSAGHSAPSWNYIG